MKSCYSGLEGLLPRLLGKGEGGSGLTAEFNPGQVLGGLLEETGLGVEEELVWCRCWPLLLSNWRMLLG